MVATGTRQIAEGNFNRFMLNGGAKYVFGKKDLHLLD